MEEDLEDNQTTISMNKKKEYMSNIIIKEKTGLKKNQAFILPINFFKYTKLEKLKKSIYNYNSNIIYKKKGIIYYNNQLKKIQELINESIKKININDIINIISYDLNSINIHDITNEFNNDNSKYLKDAIFDINKIIINNDLYNT